MPTMPVSKADLIAAITELSELHHCFLSPEGVKRFTEPFGFTGTTYRARDTSAEHPKGLSLANGQVEAEGQDAEEVARQICDRLKVDYDKSLWGRGFTLRNRCNAVLAYLEKL